MDTAVRPRKSSSSDRFLDIFYQPQPQNSATGGIEFDEDEVFFSGRDFSEPKRATKTPSETTSRNFGILAALSEEDNTKQNLRHAAHRLLCRNVTNSFSSARAIPSIPKTQISHENSSRSVPSVKFHQSVPVNVPAVASAVNKERNLGGFGEGFGQYEEEAREEEMLPPHEMVARGGTFSPATTFSVLEGAGRTLKGRDLRRVRNAVFRQTGFLD